MKKSLRRKIIALTLALSLITGIIPTYEMNLQAQEADTVRGIEDVPEKTEVENEETSIVNGSKTSENIEKTTISGNDPDRNNQGVEKEGDADEEVITVSGNEPAEGIPETEEIIVGGNEPAEGIPETEEITVSGNEPANESPDSRNESVSGNEADENKEEPNPLLPETDKEESQIYKTTDISVSEAFRIEGFEQESAELVYTGDKITQKISIYFNDILLRENIDYTLNYKNNIDAALYNSLKAPSVTIRMKGQYTGQRTLYFTIAPREIDAEGKLGYEQAVAYQKKLTIPTPVIYYEESKLVKNRDFVCDYSNLPQDYLKGDSYEQGTNYTYEVKGIGNFTGSFLMNLVVVKEENLNFQNAEVRLSKYIYEYDGDPMTAEEIQVESVRLGGKILEAAYYECTVQAEKTGTSYVVIKPTQEGTDAGYRGRKEIKITLVADRNIQDAVSGANWKEEIPFSQTILNEKGGIYQDENDILAFESDGNTEALVEGRDYTVKYKNAEGKGTAIVIFYGMGRYEGVLWKTYSIVPNNQLSVQWLDTDDGQPFAVYQKDGAVPRFQLLDNDGNVLSSRTDYNIKVRNNRKPGIMTLEIIGKGNYSGYHFKEQVQVKPADISQAAMIVEDIKYTTEPDKWKSRVIIKDVNGKKLTAGKDYEKELIYSYDGMESNPIPEAGTTITVTAQGKNNYEGSSLTGSYRICKWDLKDLIISIDSRMYTGQEIELQDSDIHVFATKNDKKENKEISDFSYEITEYRNNKYVGLAYVTLRGTGEYGGTRTCSFFIHKRAYDAVLVEKIKIEETDITLRIDESRALNVSIYPENAENKTIIWRSSDEEIAVVDENGVVTAKQQGNVVIRAISQDTKKTAVCNVTVAIIPVSFFELNTSRVEDYAGTTYQLKVKTMQPENANDTRVLWKSSDTKTASVDENGTISLNKPGMAVITAYFEYSQCIRKCMVWVKSEGETEPEGNYLIPQEFKEAEDADDTASFNRAINALSTRGYDTVYVPAGTYRINAEQSIKLKSNMKFIMSPDAVLQAVGNSSKGYNIIALNYLSNVTISGGQIVGERYEHSGSGGEWGMGIGVYDSRNIIISDVKVSNCWGDGIYIGTNHDELVDFGSKEITISNCILDNNRRNNLSIVCGDYVTVDGCTFSNANGTAPEYGIDIETNNSENPCEHIVISNSVFTGNVQGSMGIITAADDILISNCILKGKFFNWAGTNVVLSNSRIYDKTYARIGISMINGSSINEGSETADTLVASFDAGKDTYNLGKYNLDAANTMMKSYMDSSLSPSGKVLRLERTSQGTKETGYYFNLADLLYEEAAILEPGCIYRFEYVTRGYGQWGTKTDQTGWYPCVPQTERFATGITSYEAKDKGETCRLIFYAVDMTKGMSLEIDSIKIYKVN